MPLMAKLLNLSPWLVLLLINTMFIGITFLLLFLSRSFISSQVKRDHYEVISTIFARAAAMFGILLAFVVVMLWQEYQLADERALKEGNIAIDLYRDLMFYLDKAEVNNATLSYLKFVYSVVEDEYLAMAQLKRSSKTQEAINELWLNIAIIKPKTPQEQAIHNKMLRNLESLVDLRRSRLGDMGSNVPDILWVVIIIGALVTIFLATLIHAEKFWMHALAISMIVIIIANTIFLAIELDYPFLGEVSARPANYIEILESMDERSIY
jgi:Protein of unknown function (DUF4239)